MYYTLEQSCEKLHRENSKLSIRIKLLQQRTAKDDCSIRNEDVLSTKYTPWLKCIQSIPTVEEQSTKVKWTIHKLIDVIQVMFFHDTLESYMNTTIHKLGDEEESTMESLGRSVMDKIRKYYEKKQGYRATYLEQEQYFVLFPHDPIFIEVLYDMLRELALELKRHEDYRENVVEIHVNSLRQNQFLVEKQRKEMKNLKAKSHYMRVIMRKVLHNWHEIAHLRARCRRAVRLIRRVQRKSLQQRAFTVLKMNARRNREKKKKKRNEQRATTNKVQEDRPRSAPSRKRKETFKSDNNRVAQPTTTTTTTDSTTTTTEARPQSAGKRANFLMISATKLKEETTPDMINQLRENIKKQRAWLKQLEKQEKIASKK